MIDLGLRLLRMAFASALCFLAGVQGSAATAPQTVAVGLLLEIKADGSVLLMRDRVPLVILSSIDSLSTIRSFPELSSSEVTVAFSKGCPHNRAQESIVKLRRYLAVLELRITRAYIHTSSLINDEIVIEDESPKTGPNAPGLGD